MEYKSKKMAKKATTRNVGKEPMVRQHEEGSESLG